MSLIDSHCHLDDKQFDSDREATIDRALAAGVEQMLAIGTGDGPPDYEAAIRLADKYDCMLATAGVHPHSAQQADGETSKRLEALLKHPKVVALGEIGLEVAPGDRGLDLNAHLGGAAGGDVPELEAITALAS